VTGPAGSAGGSGGSPSLAALRRFVRPAGTGTAGTTEATQPGASAGPQAAPARAAARGPDPAQAPAAGPGAAGKRAPAPERCELCATEVPAEHGHIADLEAASLLCACRACYLLFTQPNAGRGKYRAVPDRYLADPSRPMSPADFDELEIPVGLAFFLRTSREGGGLTGFYPSPAGATECRLDLARWERLVADYPLLGAPESDVEAALVSRADSGVEYFLVPVDACYELAGRMRLSWRGFDGGTEARQSIAAFLADVRQRARPFARQNASQEGQRG
jgi:Family of unknown function (DUF5947)